MTLGKKPRALPEGNELDVRQQDSQQLGRIYEEKKAAHDDLLGSYFILRSHSGLSLRKPGLAPDAAAWKAIDDAHAEVEQAWEAWRRSM